jgi:putative DNA primase/helicase
MNTQTNSVSRAAGRLVTPFTRPGVSYEFLTLAGCHHVGADECVNLYGCRAEGIAIPFHSLDGQPIVDNEKPFARIRLYDGTPSQKYHQPGGSRTHIYIPHNFRALPRGATLVLTEGEFKALSLTEDGFAAIGLPGISGAMWNLDGEPRLHDELVGVLEFHQPARVLFLGDSDAVLNADFSREAAKLHKVLFDSKRFSFVQELRVAVCPLGGPKGADDVRGAMGIEFNAWFTALSENAFVVPSKATPVEIFCAMLRRESEAVRTSIKGDGHDAHCNRVRLLQSAGRLQHETGAMLLLKPRLAGLLNVKDAALAKMIKDAGQPAIKDNHIPAAPEKGRVTLRNVEPWDKPVDGDKLLAEIAAFYEKFCWLPSCAAEVLAVWSLQTWCYELFDFVAIVAVWSPEHECGKGRVLDVTEKLVRRPFRTSNTSAAVLYHVISKGNLCVLVDELDSVSDEQRSAICNILKGGYQSNGTAHRMTERNGEQVEIEFSTFCPKMIATITLDKLDKATRSRTIGIRMQRKPRSQKVAKFRRVDATIFQRKCMRWAQDNAEAIKAVPPMDVDECATDRQEDVWEPLIAIARVAGGDWEPRIRLAARQLASGGSDGASETLAHQLLSALQSFFSEHGDRADTKTIITELNESGDFADVNYGRGLTPRYVARLLKPYGIEPRVHKMNDGKPARGYSRDDCEQAFITYLSDTPPKNALVKCNSVTTVENIDRNEVFGSVTKGNGYTSESAIPANKDGTGYGVTFQKAGGADSASMGDLAAQADLL